MMTEIKPVYSSKLEIERRYVIFYICATALNNYHVSIYRGQR